MSGLFHFQIVGTLFALWWISLSIASCVFPLLVAQPIARDQPRTHRFTAWSVATTQILTPLNYSSWGRRTYLNISKTANGSMDTESYALEVIGTIPAETFDIASIQAGDIATSETAPTATPTEVARNSAFRISILNMSFDIEAIVSLPSWLRALGSLFGVAVVMSTL
ncbi:MAG: hypothetical protein M1834_001926 [Cirrosporium novae-zelandiae]|nr:MAG: hypothetical protein M1834_001926 [Cirrosporium novae-zelandiae]